MSAAETPEQVAIFRRITSLVPKDPYSCTSVLMITWAQHFNLGPKHFPFIWKVHLKLA